MLQWTKWWWSLQNDERLIVGLGNPGLAYKRTRHNIGFLIVEAFAKSQGLTWRKVSSIKGELAQGIVGEKRLFLLLPATYMNGSGEAVRRCLDYYDIPLEHLLIVADDISLPFGKIRMRPQGGAGGHNGLKSVEAYVRTQTYCRLRIGIGDREHGDLADYVLAHFSQEESEKLPEIIKQAVSILEIWILEGISAAMQIANQKGINNG